MDKKMVSLSILMKVGGVPLVLDLKMEVRSPKTDHSKPGLKKNTKMLPETTKNHSPNLPKKNKLHHTTHLSFSYTKRQNHVCFEHRF